MRLSRILAVFAGMLCAWSVSSAGAIVSPEEAPRWQVSEWVNGNPGALESHRGRVVVIHFFQLWCPGCNNFTIPLMQQWDRLWSDRDEVMIVSIHTVFEGHDYQTTERLRDFVREKGILHPVGIDDYDKKRPDVPVTMRRFENTGTPQLAVIDKEGNLVFNHFGSFDASTVEFMIERLMKERSELKPSRKPKPGHDEALSGRYKLQFAQNSKSCGNLRDPFNANMALEVFAGRMTAQFSTKVMGVQSLDARYDARSMAFDASLSRESRVGNSDVQSTLVISGRFVKGARPPRLEYEAMFSRRGARAGSDCEIQGRGSAQRIGD